MTEKQIAAEKSTEYIKDGMTLGLGTGSTVFFMVHKLAELVKQGLNVTCVSTSKQTSELAESLGIKILNLNDVDRVDLTIDGADEVNGDLNGIKGGGGALLFEKIVAKISKKNLWIVDSKKFVNQLGMFPLPIEVSSYGIKHLFNYFKSLGFNPVVRKNNGEIYYTDSGNQIIDLKTGLISDPAALEGQIKIIPGVIEVGLFNNLADIVIIGRGNTTEIILRNNKPD